MVRSWQLFQKNTAPRIARCIYNMRENADRAVRYNRTLKSINGYSSAVFNFLGNLISAVCVCPARL
jgi:hypothetical protein